MKRIALVVLVGLACGCSTTVVTEIVANGPARFEVTRCKVGMFGASDCEKELVLLAKPTKPERDPDPDEPPPAAPPAKGKK